MILQNLIPETYFNKLQSAILHGDFNWHWKSENIARNAPDGELFQLTHRLVTDNQIQSKYAELINPVLFFLRKKTNIKIKNVLRIKVNLIPRIVQKDEWLENIIHQDNEKDNHLRMILYINSSDGDTAIFENDKTTIKQTSNPIANNAILFKSNLWHRASPPKENKRRVIINFIFEVESDDIQLKDYDYETESKLNDFLKSIGTKDLPHKNGQLYDHLMRTYFLAQDMFDNKDISLIAGLHSAYGTTVYKNKCLDVDSQILKKTFSEKIDKYVRMFGTMNRQLLETPDESINKEDLNILRFVEIANLLDQGALNKRPNLIKFMEQNKK
jgi:hypothetical protein